VTEKTGSSKRVQLKVEKSATFFELVGSKVGSALYLCHNTFKISIFRKILHY
jgi:hypothetical protein